MALVASVYCVSGCGNNSSSTSDNGVDSIDEHNRAGNTDNANQNPDDSSGTVRVNSADTIGSNGARDNNSLDNNTSALASLRSPLDTMLKKIESTKMTGDFDIDYAIMMIDHHQSAVAMSGYEISNGKDDKVKEVARRIMNSQNEEITKLKAFLKSYLPSKLKQGQGVLTKSATDMKTKLNNVKLTGDTDKDYASLMIAHHQYGIDLADKLQINGASDDLKKLAKEEKTLHTKDIKDLKAASRTK